MRNLEKHRQYNKDWYQRKKAGLPTRLTPIRSKEERLKREKERNASYRQKKKNAIDKAWGATCFFCEHDKVRIIHNKEGNPHKQIAQMNWTELNDIIGNHKDEYVRVCGVCHKGIHWCMKFLGMTWNSILANRTCVKLFGI